MVLQNRAHPISFAVMRLPIAVCLWIAFVNIQPFKYLYAAQSHANFAKECEYD